MTDRRRVDPGARTRHAELLALERLIDLACAASVDLIHIRERDLDGATLRALVAHILATAGPNGPRILVNDRADVAAITRAGLHLRADGPAPSRVRSLLSGPAVMGKSVHSPDEARAASGADYLLFGSVFPTEGKPGAPAAGLAALRSVTAIASMPVFAIGGLDPRRAEACAAAGAEGVAAIGAFLPTRTAGYPDGLAGVVRDFTSALAAGRRGAVQ